MWKAFIYTLLGEMCLYGFGLLTVPDWVNGNIHIWLPMAFGLLLVMTCWDNWPRLLQVNQRFRWADLESGGRYYRDLLSGMGMKQGVQMFDSMSSPHPEQPTSSPVASAFRWIVQEAINEGKMEVWGIPENGSAQRISHVEDDMDAYRKSREGDAMFLMMDGVYYRDLQIKRSTIKSYVEHVRRHDAFLDGA